MDDPNAALPSDPTVDESYTKGSRPVRPRAPPEGAPPAPHPPTRLRRTGPGLVASPPTPGIDASSPDASAASPPACC